MVAIETRTILVAWAASHGTVPAVADWILNFTKGGVKHKKQLSAQARELLGIGLWGIPTTAQARGKIAVGDRLLVYVGAPERVFVGHATVAAGWHEWSSEEAAQYPLTSTFAAGIALDEAVAWPKPVPLASVWPGTEGAKTNPNALWYGAAVRVTKGDHDAILAAGQGESAPVLPTASASSAPKAAATTVLPESEALFKTVARLRAYLSDPKPINEAKTRAFFLDKVFEALGYTEFADIDHGTVVQSGDFPDYVLRSAGEPVIAVEAKRIGHQLGAKEASQLVKYCSVLGLRWGLLTDGRFLKVYDAPVTGRPPEDRVVLVIDLNDWADREDFDVRRWPETAMLSKAAMADGEALERYAARDLIRSLIADPGSQTVKALRKELESKKLVLPEATIASLVDELLT